jgi:hypothetical protein
VTSFTVSRVSRRKLDANASDQLFIFDEVVRKQEANLNTGLQTMRLEHSLTNQQVIDQHEKTRRVIIGAMFQMAQWGLNSRFPQGFSVTYDEAKRQAKRLAPALIAEDLAFTLLENRFEGIPEAYRSTFEWVWHGQKCESRLQCELAEWFQQEGGLFWISGKAGSGKSTLMKFICNDKRTWETLKIWAGLDHLVYGSFFFWKSGTALQRTQVGLLRSLLYCALHQRPELVAFVFPEKLQHLEQILTDHLYDAQIDAKDMSSISLPSKFRALMDIWPLTDLKNAFRLLLCQNVLDTKFCFMIDGVDEFDGDYTEIVNLLKDVVKFHGVKICISSRPLRVFERAFDRLPGFRVQDLTECDIRLYIAGNLHNNIDMVELVRKEPHRATRLTQMIVEKASGVFLWVQLVVKSLLNGLMNQDTIVDLERRLELLPPDLEDLYRHMISKVDLLYRPRAFKFFHFATYMDIEPLALLLSLFDEEDLDLPIKARIQLMPELERLERVTDVTARITNACAGLLEVHRPKDGKCDEARVQFMHRTVLDFFEKPDVREELKGFSKDSPQKLDLALLGTLLLHLKWLLPPPGTNTACRDFWKVVQHLLSTASRADAKGTRLGMKFIDEFDRVASYHWNGAFSSSRRSQKLSPEAAHWTNWMDSEYDIGLDNSLLTHAVRYQLSSYLSERAIHNPGRLQTNTDRHLLDVAVPPVHFFTFQAAPAPQMPSITIIEMLLQAGGDPNKVYNLRTPWENALCQICNRQQEFPMNDPSEMLQFGQTWTRVLKLLLQYGADIHASVKLSAGRQETTRSAAFIINVVLRQYDAAGADELRDILISKGIHARDILRTLQPSEASRLPVSERSTNKSTLRVPYRLRLINTKPGERLDLYSAAHKAPPWMN